MNKNRIRRIDLMLAGLVLSIALSLDHCHRVIEGNKFADGSIYEKRAPDFGFLFSNQNLSENRYLIITYINKSSCDTCVNEIMLNLTRSLKKIHNVIDLIVVEGVGRRKSLGAIQRIAKFKFSILKENYTGESGLVNKFHVALVDKSTNTFLTIYYPNMGNIGDFPDFEKLFISVLQ